MLSELRPLHVVAGHRAPLEDESPLALEWTTCLEADDRLRELHAKIVVDLYPTPPTIPFKPAPPGDPPLGAPF